MTVRTVFAGALALCAASLPVYAQGYIGGYALDSATSTPLPCLQVALIDTSGRVVARQLTTGEGQFQLDAPPKGTYRLRFFAWAHDTLLGPAEELEPTTERTRKYVLTLRPDAKLAARAPAAPGTGKTADTAADAPPRLPRHAQLTPLRYPQDLRENHVQGEVIVHYVVDSTGRVIPPTVQIARSTNQGFTDAVLPFLRLVQYAPARLDHHPVCALMRDWPFTFSLR
jgi:TonB family protein